MTLAQAALALGGRMLGADATFNGVTIDSRAVQQQDLFVAIRGERFDGHDFVGTALDGGAVGAMVRANFTLPERVASLVQVEDTRLGLGKLARAWRDHWRGKLAAITGSNGKTTVKEMLAAILREHVARASFGADSVLATYGNLNNDLGVPLTLLKLNARHRYAVIEMGMNHAGELKYLSELAQPQVALVNNVQRAHAGHFDSLEAVARAKAEIFAHLKFDGVAVINADDPHAGLLRMTAGDFECLEFGVEKPAPVSARYELRGYASHIALHTPRGDAQFVLPLPGTHNVHNAIAAAAVALALGIDTPTVAAGLERMQELKGRLVRTSTPQGATLIDDTYNANPDSVKAAIEVLTATDGKKILVLGDLGELGEDAAQWHAELGIAAKEAGVDQLFSLGTLAEQCAHSFGEGAQHCESVEQLSAAIAPLLAPGVTVLVKGSRFMRMERVVAALTAAGGGDAA